MSPGNIAIIAGVALVVSVILIHLGRWSAALDRKAIEAAHSEALRAAEARGYIHGCNVVRANLAPRAFEEGQTPRPAPAFDARLVKTAQYDPGVLDAYRESLADDTQAQTPVVRR